MPIGPTLETERLILRPPEAADFEGFCEMMGDEEAARYLGGVQSRPVVWRSLAYMVGSWSLRGYSMWSVIEKSSGDWVGRLGPLYPEGWPAREVGWSLKPSAWGKGYATEGAIAAMDYVFETLGWDSVIHCIDKENIGSIKVAARLGSQFQRKVDAPDPYAGYVWDIYGQSAKDWQRNRAALVKS
jgi:RimJ/RimL family protein N-acetyltransferase